MLVCKLRWIVEFQSYLQLADSAKAQFSLDQSDHLAILRAYEGWKIAETSQAGYDYCWKNFISVQSMKAIDSLRKEFFSLLKDAGLVNSDMASNDLWSDDIHLVRAIICYGLYPGICSVVVSEIMVANLFRFIVKKQFLFLKCVEFVIRFSVITFNSSKTHKLVVGIFRKVYKDSFSSERKIIFNHFKVFLSIFSWMYVIVYAVK